MTDDQPADPWRFEEIESLERCALSHGRLHVGRGAGPVTFLFVHGGYHGAWCWIPLMRELSQCGVRSAALDLRGHGGLPQDPVFVRQGVRDMAQDVVEGARQIGRPVILVGHSVGALVAMVAAETLDLEGLVLLAPSPPGQMPGLSPLPSYPPDQVVKPPEGETARAKFLAGYEGGIEQFLCRLCPESPGLLNDRYELRIHVDASRIDSRSLCLAAGRDSAALHPPGQDEACARFLGGAYHSIDNAAHDMMLDSAMPEVAQRLLAWARSGVPRG